MDRYRAVRALTPPGADRLPLQVVDDPPMIALLLPFLVLGVVFLIVRILSGGGK